MKALKKVEELKEIVADDNRAFQILGEICKENRKDYWLRICGIEMFLAGVVCIIFSVTYALKVNISEMIATLGILFVLVGVYISVPFGFDSKEIISDDELKYLNAVLERKTVISEGIFPIIQEGKQCFIEENNVIKSVGEVSYKGSKTECEKICYMEIEDWKDISYPRYQVVRSVHYIK